MKKVRQMKRKIKRYYNAITGQEYPAKPKDKKVKLIVVKTTIAMVVLVFFLAMANASSINDPDDYFKPGNIDYTKPCINNGTYCSSGAVCNVTAYYSNGTSFLNNARMTNNGAYHNYTIENQTSGNYKTNVVCCDGGNCGSQTFYYEINPSGIAQSSARTTANTLAIIIIFIISGAMFFAFMFFKHPAAKYSFIVMSAIFLLVGINLLFVNLSQVVSSPEVLNLFDFITAASYYFYWLGGGILCVILILTVFTSFYDKYKNLKLAKYGGELYHGE